MNKSYIMIKPEGQRYLEEIENIIFDFGFAIEGIYYVEDWEFICTQIYSKCLNEHDELFMKDFLGHVWLNKYLFGNQSLVIMLSKRNFANEELLAEIMRMKKYIRKKYNATKNGTFMLLMDLSKAGITSSDVNNGQVTLLQGTKQECLDEMISQVGFFRTFFLQYVHCPDVVLHEAEEEIEMLKRNNVISNFNLVDETGWNFMKKHRTLKLR